MTQILNPDKFAAFIQDQAPSILGIDYGSKNLGLAYASSPTYVTTPLNVLKRTTLKKDFQALEETRKDFPFHCVVVGLPLNMDGSEGAMAQAAKQFGFYLSTTCHWPVCFWDERLSSVEAAERSFQRKQKRLDHVAAHIILESFLNFYLKR
jgi:putative Holliday junction resolvase